jgi:hypothetical protein
MNDVSLNKSNNNEYDYLKKKKNIISRPFFMEIGEGPYTSKWVKSNRAEETWIIRLKGKEGNFVSLRPL